MVDTCCACCVVLCCDVLCCVQGSHMKHTSFCTSLQRMQSFFPFLSAASLLERPPGLLLALSGGSCYDLRHAYIFLFVSPFLKTSYASSTKQLPCCLASQHSPDGMLFSCTKKAVHFAALHIEPRVNWETHMAQRQLLIGLLYFGCRAAHFGVLLRACLHAHD